MELDLSFMEEALPFLIKAIPVTIFITAATLILSLVPAFLMAEKRVRGGGKGKAEKLIMLYISFYPRNAARPAGASRVCAHAEHPEFHRQSAGASHRRIP